MNTTLQPLLSPITALYWRIRAIGVRPQLDDFERRKLAIFNLLNCFGLLNGIIIPVVGFFSDDPLPAFATLIALSPALISTVVLAVNSTGRNEQAKMIYFVLYPLITALAYATNTDIGIELFFIGYGVLAIFLVKSLRNAIISFGFSILLYFIVFVFWRDYEIRVVDFSPAFFVFTHILAACFIFFSLYLFKTENFAHQFQLKNKNRELAAKNREIDEHRLAIANKVEQLEQKATELKELDTLKNKLFSVIAHDLKTPMYALRNLFRNVHQFDIPGDEIKAMIPDVVTDLNYTTGLMENLLQWAKSQMQSDALRPQKLDVAALIKEVMQLLRLQADSKKVYLQSKLDAPVYIYADRDMVHLILRNLVSNAIKFTAENGYVFLDANAGDSFVEVSVEDTGAGMNEETLKKINASNFFTTKGTAGESGTGLGLMLCKEFLAKNGGRMFVESEAGKGSTFSFTLPSDN